MSTPDHELRLLVKAEDVTDHILVLVANVVEDRYPEGPIPEDAFIDWLCDDYAYADGWDIENLNTPAVRKIMRHARQVQREMV